jgi:hypothetical protein
MAGAQDERERLRQALSVDRSLLVQRWMEHLEKLSWSMPDRQAVAGPLEQRCLNFLNCLHAALADHGELSTGSVELREPIQVLSFTAGWLAGAGTPIGTAVNLCFALERALATRLPDFIEALVVAVSEAYAAGLSQSSRAKHRDIIEKSQVVCLLDDKLPCLFLVADPDQQALNEAIGRAMTLVVMRNASVLILDASGLVAPGQVLPQALRLLAEQRENPPTTIIVSAISAALVRALEESPMRSAKVLGFEQLREAIAIARTLSN